MQKHFQSEYHGSVSIILADDDADDRDLFEEAASIVAPDLKIALARNGEELIEHLLKLQPKPDMVFLDLNMPKKNGKECLTEIQSNSSLRNIPIIIYTTSLNQLDVEETYVLGARHFFRKPNSFEELKALLQKLLSSDLSGARIRETFVLTSQ